MIHNSKERRSANLTQGSGQMRYRIGASIACLVLYTLAMFGVRAYAHSIGRIGGLVTIVAMFVASYWYEHRQERKQDEILPPTRIDGQGH